MTSPIDIHNPYSIDIILEAARRHGEQSEPDHEVGDLQDALRICWKLMTPTQREQMAHDHGDSLLMWAPTEGE